MGGALLLGLGVVLVKGGRAAAATQPELARKRGWFVAAALLVESKQTV